MLQYAREMQHEKIIRGLAMGTAFIFYNWQEEADETITVLFAEKVGYVESKSIILGTNLCNRILSSDTAMSIL